MMRYILQCEYDGTAYAGFQLQKRNDTIQGRIEKALETIYRQPVRIHGSGRTDAGVHAHFQIIHFDPPVKLLNFNLKAALNSNLPPDIRILQTAQADDTFHARFSARERQYRYRILAGETAINRQTVWQIRQPIDINAMTDCAVMIHGEHDFTAFCSMQAEVKHKRCIILESEWIRTGRELHFHITANRFLHNMVRSLVGTMAEVGKKRLSPDDFRNILESKDRLAGAVTAPPQGLSLINVIYQPPIQWETA